MKHERSRSIPNTTVWLYAWDYEAIAFDIVLPVHPEYDVKLFDVRNLPLAQ